MVLLLIALNMMSDIGVVNIGCVFPRRSWGCATGALNSIQHPMSWIDNKCIYIYNISVICGPNITVQCKEYEYIVTYGTNTHSNTYKKKKEKKHKEEKNI